MMQSVDKFDLMDGLIHRQLNRIYRRECQAGRLGSKKPVQSARINCDSDNILTYVSDDYDKFLPGLYIASKSLQPEVNEYFEIEILDCGSSGEIAIGLVPTNHPLDQLPGFVAGSIGYNAGDGRIYLGHQRGTLVGTKCEIGDRIGCGVRIENSQSHENYNRYDVLFPLKMKVYFTLNSVEIGSTFVTTLLLRGGLYPAIALCSPGEEVKLNLNMRFTPSSISSSISDDKMCVDSYEDDWMRLHDIRLNGNILEYAGRGKSIFDVGLAQARRPLDTRYHYFEIEIIDPGENCYIAIGLTRKEYPKHSHPGWHKGSIAYHADDGKIFIGSGAGDPFGPRCHRGDIMGCGIIFPRDYNCNNTKTKQNIKNLNQINEDDSADDLIFQNSSSDETEKLSQSSHSGAENDSPDSDQNSDYSFDDQNWDQDWLMGIPNAVNRYGYGDWNLDRYKNYNRPLLGQRIKRPDRNNDLEYKKVKVDVFFTRNGTIIGQKQVSIPKDGFFPTIGMLSTAEKVKVDLHPLTG